MKRSLLVLALALILSVPCRADDRLRDVQSALKTQGFYYGEVNGKESTETSAAIRRYQIRNGLEVTGTLTDETVKAIGGGSAPGARPAEETPPPSPKAQPTAPARQNPRKNQALENSDKNFLRREEAKQRAAEPVTPLEDDPSVVPAPRPLEVPSAELSVLFADTPYANAPAEVQESTLRRVQSILTSRGFYRDPIDGEPGPATEEAILAYQRSSRLRLTGRLDLETLNTMRLMPGRASVPLKGFVPDRSPATGQRVYRGVWIR
ncbi:MAG: peptidoglycan-binding protein [Chthoniobacteraceae bacterium]